jgi:LuxR family transcriptional regulator, maltose regulon positive regulatory protein
MSRKLPRIDAVGMTGLSDPAVPGVFIYLDSAAWFSWLEAAETRCFTYALEDEALGYIVGWMTVRKEERVRGGKYWTAYRRAGGRLRKVYLGGSVQVTAARLKEVAERLRVLPVPAVGKEG